MEVLTWIVFVVLMLVLGPVGAVAGSRLANAQLGGRRRARLGSLEES
jgi:hypothetical protein